MQTRIYVVAQNVPEGQPKEVRLVEATSQAQAIRHVVSGLYGADVAKPKDVASLVQRGVKVEQAAVQGV